MRSLEMGLEVEITGSDGRRYNSLADMVEAEGKALIEGKVSAIRSAIAAQRCSVHNVSATSDVHRVGDRVEFAITACCEELRDRAQTAADRALRK
jgi:hypothetical protein